MRDKILQIAEILENITISGSRNASLLLNAISDLHLLANVLAEVEKKPEKKEETADG